MIYLQVAGLLLGIVLFLLDRRFIKLRNDVARLQEEKVNKSRIESLEYWVSDLVKQQFLTKR